MSLLLGAYDPKEEEEKQKERKKLKKQKCSKGCEHCILGKGYEHTPVFSQNTLIPFETIRENETEKIVVILVPHPDYGCDDLLSYKTRELIGTWTRKYLVNATKIYLFPIVRCPTNKDPTKKSVELCEPYLREALVKASPNVIIGLGKATGIPFKMTGKANEVMGRVYSVAPIKLGNTVTQECKLIITHSPDKFIEDTKIISSVESAFVQANRLLSNEVENKPDNYYLIESPKEFADWVDIHLSDKILSKTIHAFDIETNGRNIHPTNEFEVQHPAKIRCISFSWSDGYGVCVPLEDDYESYYPILKKFMESDTKFIGHNVAFDYFFLKLINNITVKRIIGDTMLMAYLLDPGRGQYGYGLKRLACELTNLGGYETDMKSTEDELDADGNIIKTKWEIANMETMAPYNCADSDTTLRIYKQFIDQIKEQNMMPAHWILTNAWLTLGTMSHNGLFINREWVDNSRKRIEELISGYEAELTRLCNGKSFDWNSPQQIGHVLYDLLGYAIPNTESGVPLTNESDEKNRPTGDTELSIINTPFTQCLRKYRRASKLLSTYFNGYLINNDLD